MPKQVNYEKNKKSKIGSSLKGKTFTNAAKITGKGLAGGAKIGSLVPSIKKQEQKINNLKFSKTLNDYKVKGMTAAVKKIKGQSSIKTIKNYQNTIRTGIAGAAKSIKDNTNTAKGFATKAKKLMNVNSNNTAKAGSTSDPYKVYYDLWNKNNALNVGMFREANEFNAKQAAEQRGFEEMMSNTAHQREVADLKAAGLNPILSAGGMGASTPSGAAASANNFNGADTSLMGALAELAASSISANATMTAAQTHANAQKEAAMISGQYGYLSAGQAAAATQYAAQVAAGASMYGADQSRAASMYGADQSRIASMYGANKGYQGTRYSSDKSYKGTIYGSTINTAGDMISGFLRLIPFL